MLLFGDRNLHFLHNRLGNIALQLQHVPKFAVIYLRPEMRVGGGANELGMDTDAIAVADYRSFDNRINAKCSRDLRNRKLSTFELHDGRAGGDADAANCSETPDDLLGHPISKVFL